MPLTRLDFSTSPWVQGAHPLERKNVPVEGQPILIEFESGFRDPNVCTRGHIIYVVSGALGLELDEGFEIIGAGEAVVIDTGTAHRAFNDGPEIVRLFIVSEKN